MNSKEALAKLKEGNQKYLAAKSNPGDISPAIREDTTANGQHPYAIVITCSDSRVIPESIFSAGIGELFVIRVAGNVMDKHQLGSVEYAAGHLSTPLVLVLGHTHCGAVGAALSGHSDGYITSITDEIAAAIGDTKDEDEACRLNTENSVNKIKTLIAPAIREKTEIIGAIYDIKSGEVNWL